MRSENTIEDKSIYHKNLMPVTYVTADIAGEIESPVYAMFKLGPQIGKIKIPEGYAIQQHMAALPSDSDRYSMMWDGEWHITYEMFRDLGIAFAVVLILIYGLVVGWFQSFLTPLIIMVAIPFSLVGILPPTDDADHRGGGGGHVRHAVRSHFSRPGDRGHGRRDRFSSAFANDAA